MNRNEFSTARAIPFASGSAKWNRGGAGIAMWSAAMLLALLLMAMATGCKSSTSAPPASPAQSSQTPGAPAPAVPVQSGQAPATQPAMNSDGTQASAPAQQPPAQQMAAEPVGTPAPAGAPGTEAMAPAPEAPAPIVRHLPAGTSIPVRITETLSAKQNDVGDRFTGVIAQNVVVGGNPIVKTGTKVTGRVIAAKGQGKFKGEGALGIELTSIAGVPVRSSEYEAVVKGKGKRTAGFIGGGGAGGALIGGLAGGGKGALIGGLVGAGAGTAAGAYTGNKDVVIASETLVRFTLTAPVTMP